MWENLTFFQDLQEMSFAWSPSQPLVLNLQQGLFRLAFYVHLTELSFPYMAYLLDVVLLIIAASFFMCDSDIFYVLRH